MNEAFVPTLNALLNALAAGLLVFGRSLARSRRFDRHRRVMIAAFAVSTLFLVIYVSDKVATGFASTTFNADGLARVAYLVLLTSHVALAATVPWFAIALIVLGLRDRRPKHRRLARVAWPVWMYVSVTGVVIYLLLYPLNPGGA